MTMKPHSFILSLLSLFAILFLSTSIGYAKPLPAQSQQIGLVPLLCITSAPSTSAFPDVSLNFRMMDGNLSPIIPADTEMRFSENGQPPVPLVNGIQSDPFGGGIDYYIIVDKGNRSSQTAIRSILQTFVSFGYYNEKTDNVRIYTNVENGSQLYYQSGASGNTFADAVANFPINSDSNYRLVTQSFEKALSEIEANTSNCQNMRVIIMMMGDDALSENDVLKFAQRAKSSLTKLAIFHVPGSNGSSEFVSRNIYSNLANQSSGNYRQIRLVDSDVKPGLDELVLYKQIFSTTYRTNYGGSGTHNISATYQNANVMVQGQSSYAVEVLPPTVVALVGDTTIDRSALSKTSDGQYVYSTDDVSRPYVFQLNWSDSYPRNIKSAALVVKEDQSENETVLPLVPKGDNTYEINWNFSPIKSDGRHTLYLSVKVTDEFDYQAISSPIEIVLTNNTEIVDGPPAWVPIVLIVLGSVVIVLLILMIFMWRKMLSFAKQGGAVLGKIAGEIRQTIVGGGRRGKPLATFKVLDGPPNMIGQELKIYTESAKLGRNPQLADLTFYAPDVITSVSGLHARLEKVNGAWRIVALSQSGSETFIDDKPIPFNEPVGLRAGQKIRLGYFAQQPVVFEFQAEQTGHYVTSVDYSDEVRKTNVKIDPDETIADADGGFFTKPNKKSSTQKKQSSEKGDSVFDEFR